MKEFRQRRDAVEREVAELKAAYERREESQAQQLQQVQTKCLEEKVTHLVLLCVDKELTPSFVTRQGSNERLNSRSLYSRNTPIKQLSGLS